MATAFSPALVYCCLLRLVQLLQWLVRLAFTRLSYALKEIIWYLEDRPTLESGQSLSDKVIQKFLQQSNGKYGDYVSMEKIGYRTGRHWYKVTGPDGRDKLLTLTPVSEHCPLHLEEESVMTALNALLRKIQVPVLHSVEEVCYSSEVNSLVLIQPFISSGSLKDLVYQTSPNCHWKVKYGQDHGAFKETRQDARTSSGLSSVHEQTISLSDGLSVKRSTQKSDPTTTGDEQYKASLQHLISLSQRSPKMCKGIGCGLSMDKVASYGRQILQGLLYFYDLGFPYLGQIQPGNIFIDKDVCLLGGYENTLLGYRTRFHKLCSNDSIDAVMFGHLIFEIGCGYELTSLIPSSEELERVTDCSLLDVLCLIFHTDEQGRFTSTIEKICAHPFFQCVRLLPQNSKQKSRNSALTSDLCTLLSQLTQAMPSKYTQKHSKHRHKNCIIQ